MNKKFILPALVLVIVLAGLAFYYSEGSSLQGRFSTVTKAVTAVAKLTGVGQGIIWNFEEYTDIGQWTLTLRSGQYISSMEFNDGMSPLSLSEMKLYIDGTEISSIDQGETTFTVGDTLRAGDHTVVVSGMITEDFYQNALAGFGDVLNFANITHGADSSSTSETELNVTYSNMPYYLYIDPPELTVGTVASSANLASAGVIYNFVLDLDDSDHRPENIPFNIDSSSLNFASGTTDYGTIALYMDGTQVSSTKTFDPAVSTYAFRLMKRTLTDGGTFELKASLKGLSSGSIKTTFSAGNFIEKRTYTTDGTDDPDYYYCYSKSFATCFYPLTDTDYYLTKDFTVTHSGGTGVKSVKITK